MLYVSKKLADNKIGVTDTDDGVETIVSLRQLGQIVLKLGLKVRGVVVERGRIVGVSISKPPDKTEILRRIYRDVLNERSLRAYQDECRLYEDQARIEARFLTGMGNWYSSEQERDFGETVDVCDADSIRVEGRRILEEFCKKESEKYGVEVDWVMDSEKAWSAFYVY